jgi:hypothetical protein
MGNFQKILEISADQFMKQGVSTGKHTTEGGLFWRAYGIDPFIVPGLLQSGYPPTQFASATVSDTINYFLPSVSASDYVFGYGTNGTTASIYRIDSGYGVSAMCGLSASQALGFEGFKGDIYYSNNAYVGQLTNYNVAPTGSSWNSQLINLTASVAGTEHPLHSFATDLYIGDGFYLHSWNGTTKTAEELVLPSDYTIIDIDNDGNYLVIAAIKKGRSGLTKSINKIFYWDTISDNNFYSAEWEIPDGKLTGISKSGNGNEMIAFTGQGMYSFSISNAPQLIIPGNDGSFYPVSSNELSPFSGAIQHLGGCIVWGSGSYILKYGKVFNNLPNILTYPATLASIKSIYVDAYNRLFASTTDKKLYKITSGNAEVQLRTGHISLPQPTLIQKIKVYAHYSLGAGESIKVELANENVGTVAVSKTFDTSTVDSSKLSWVLPCDVLANGLSIDITLSGGVEIKKIELYGEPRPFESTI